MAAQPTTKRLRQVAAAAFLCAPLTATAQSADALIDKLVDKGILSVKEANELREEADRNFNQAYSVKTGLPDYVSSLRISGDVRGRYEGFFSNADYDPAPASGSTDFVDRSRYRFRMRVGVVATLFDNLELGLRLTSSENASGGTFGGDPISGNTTFQDNGSKKYVFIDQAYGRWNFLNTGALAGSFTVGKMENPFTFSDMLFDPDYTPEGVAVNGSYRFSDTQLLRLNLGGFALDELRTSGNDPYLLGAQVRMESTWSHKIATTAGLGAFTIENPDQLTTSAVPNQAAGNTRLANGELAEEFTPLVADASFTYSLSRFPLYRGAFPIRLAGEYLVNPSADRGSDNYGWNAGVTFGKSGKRGTWDFSYTYKWLGANAQWEELVDSDFGAFYAQTSAFPGPGAAAGYANGTNVRGHILRLAYSPTDALTLSAKWFVTELIEENPKGSDSNMSRLQLDASLRF